ncbi:uncharacterized protein LOC126037497 isoform X1 [Accipiter gentilis]|uniref:uncharacterized protein LOC126037497 isoform X1 n=1 Tax=Astur gentilis TaxID=8957 RepID=UPI002110214B|nr:uncharacterized protein LOC126037497 isoform X1 [Accipiter gentilis]
MVPTLGGSNKDPGTPVLLFGFTGNFPVQTIGMTALHLDRYNLLSNICNSWSPAGTGGARPDPPQRLTSSSSPGLPHSPSPRAEGAQTQPGGQRGRPASVYSVSRAPIESCQRVCSGARGAPRRSPCPSDTSDSTFPYVLYGTSKYLGGFNTLYQLWFAAR